ncbi:MAG: hypothetical protein FWB91_13340 [Defluviitaleaceae bacterium]|nr:hypothetical protein [Defluviitaleaceae bacterium]
MEKSKCNGLNVKELLKSKQSVFISTKEALEDVEPIQWSEHVINGNFKVTISEK